MHSRLLSCRLIGSALLTGTSLFFLLRAAPVIVVVELFWMLARSHIPIEVLCFKFKQISSRLDTSASISHWHDSYVDNSDTLHYLRSLNVHRLSHKVEACAPTSCEHAMYSMVSNHSLRYSQTILGQGFTHRTSLLSSSHSRPCGSVLV